MLQQHRSSHKRLLKFLVIVCLQKASTCLLMMSENHNDMSPVSEEAWGITAAPSKTSVGSNKRAPGARLRSPHRKPPVNNSRALIPTRQAAPLRQADHQSLVIVGGNEARGSMSQHEKAAAVKRGKGKGSRGVKSPRNETRHANQAEEPPEALSHSLTTAAENSAAEV